MLIAPKKEKRRNRLTPTLPIKKSPAFPSNLSTRFSDKIKIIYQDDSLLVINKPAGLVTLKTDFYKKKTLQFWLEEKFDIHVSGRGGLAHRLDKDTWGIILAAKSETVFRNLQSQFKKRLVRKTYWALVRGSLLGEGKIKAPIKKISGQGWRFKVVPDGKQSLTKYRNIKSLRIGDQSYSLLEVELETGRTHQIRVHLKYLGHPIFGDPLYGGKKEKDKKMFLVAKKISFFHPGQKRQVEFEIGLPKELKLLINYHPLARVKNYLENGK